MAALTEGFPYAVQLLGSYVWKANQQDLNDDVIDQAYAQMQPYLVDSSFRAIDIFDGNLQTVLLTIAVNKLTQFSIAQLHTLLPTFDRTKIQRQVRRLREYGLVKQSMPRTPYIITFRMFMDYLAAEYNED